MRVSVRSEGFQAVVAVADDGIGISPEDVPRVFEKFFRAADAATVGGTGLGLAVAAEIAASHDGTLEVSSAPGAGSTFVLTLPLGVANPTAPSPAYRF